MTYFVISCYYCDEVDSTSQNLTNIMNPIYFSVSVNPETYKVSPAMDIQLHHKERMKYAFNMPCGPFFQHFIRDYGK